MSRVLVIATSRKTRGGITSVIKVHESGEQWKCYHCHWVQTHRDGPAWRKIIYLAIAWIDFLIRLPFYDIVHVHFSTQTSAKRKLPFVLLSKLCGKKVIAHLHCGSQIHKIWNKDYEKIFSSADICLFLSDSLKKMVEQHTGSKDKYKYKYKVCYNPCPRVHTFDNLIDKKQQILFSATLSEAKGYRDLIDAFAKIAPDLPSWNLVFAGNGEVDKARRLAESLGIAERVQFCGWLHGEDKWRMYAQSSIFCLPSYAEGFPMAVLDAWAYGLPVITTAVGGVVDIAINGENTLLFNPGDVETLASQIRLMISDKVLQERIKAASVELSQKVFNPDVINAQIANYYKQLTII